MISSKNMIKIIKYIDYLYVSNYITNTLKYSTDNKLLNEWKIFSIYSNSQSVIEKYNIFYLIKVLNEHSTFTYDLFLWTIYVYKKICFKLAHIIDNYVYLFASIYAVGIKFFEIKYDCSNLLFEILNISKQQSLKMIYCIEMFYNFNNIFFSNYEKSKIINQIKCS